MHNYLQPKNARKESIIIVYILGENNIVNAIVKQSGQNIVYQLLYLSSKEFVSTLYSNGESYSISSKFINALVFSCSLFI